MVETKNNLPGSARVWVYQSNRPFTSEEVKEIQDKLEAFNLEWAAHGTNLNSAVEIFYNQFIVFFVDEAAQGATGCSIDKSVVLVKQLESDYNVALLDRLNLAYKDGNSVVNIRMSDFQNEIKTDRVSPTTIVFNNLVVTKEEFQSKWEVPAIESWHKNLF